MLNKYASIAIMTTLATAALAFSGNAYSGQPINLTTKPAAGPSCSPPCPQGQRCVWNLGPGGGVICTTRDVIKPWQPGDPLPRNPDPRAPALMQR